MTGVAGYGVGVWSSPGWRAEAIAWFDVQLAAAGLRRTGPVEQPRVRPWSTLLRAPTSSGYVWLKATASRTAFEVPLYEVLARVVPEQVLHPIGLDVDRGWILLRDGGPTLSHISRLPAALADFGRLQRVAQDHVEELIAAGVPDMRPAVMPKRFEQALEAVADLAESPEDRELVKRIADMRRPVCAWCDQLARSPIPASIDHNDLHPFNVLGTVPPFRYYDWGDSVVAHPFAVTYVPMSMIKASEHREIARDAYLEGWEMYGSHDELVEVLEVARRVATVARALTWERALADARDQGEAVPEQFAKAPLETLAELLEDA
jgi:hypothetical protein